MYEPLVPCPSCRRHVRAAEGACPFCSAISPRGAASADAPARVRLGRAAVAMFSASVALGACTPSGGATGTSGQPATTTPATAPTAPKADPTTPKADPTTPKATPTAPRASASGKPAPTGPDDNGSVFAEYGAPARH